MTKDTEQGEQGPLTSEPSQKDQETSPQSPLPPPKTVSKKGRPIGRPRIYPPGAAPSSKKPNPTQPFFQGRPVKEKAQERAAGSRLGAVAKTLRGFSLTDVATNAELIALIEADPKPSQKAQAFVSEWKKSQEKGEEASVKALCKRANISPADVLAAFARGIREVGVLEARARVADTLTERLGLVVSTLIDQAVPQELPCVKCEGTRRVENKTCFTCAGMGYVKTLPPSYEFAVKEVLRLSQIVEPNTGMTFQQNNVTTKQTLNVGAGFMEKLTTISDQHVFEAQIVDAQLTEPKPVLIEDNSDAAGEAGESLSEATGEAISI